MTLPQVISRNQIQKTNKRTISLTNDVVQPTTWYTCPTGKIAVVKGICTCASIGAAATADLNLGGVRFARWVASGGNQIVVRPIQLEPETFIEFKADLVAADIIETVQDSGTNAQFKFQAEIEEFNI